MLSIEDLCQWHQILNGNGFYPEYESLTGGPIHAIQYIYIAMKQNGTESFFDPNVYQKSTCQMGSKI